MKKVILINSPIYDKKVADTEDYLPSLGHAYIATSLLDNNIEVKLVDAIYNNYTIEELLTIINREKPDYVGINIFSINFELVKKLIENCETETKFIIGAKSTRFLYENIMKFKTKNEINIIIGEGELIISAIINKTIVEKPYYETDNRKTYLVNDNSIYLPKNLDDIKLNRKFLEGREIINPYGLVEEVIVTSRECLYNCSFCGGARSLNKDVCVRQRTKENIEEELNYINHIHPNTECIRILDDLFLKNKKSIEEAIDIFSNHDFKFRAMTHILSLKNSYDLLPKLKESGCLELEIGIESGSDKIRKSINKVGTVEDIKIGIKKILDFGINVKGYFIYGLPDEELKDAMETLKLAKELSDYSKMTEGKFKTSAFQFRPYHGTEIYNKINKKIQYEHNDNLDDMKGRQQFNFSAGNFSKYDGEFIEQLVKLTNNLNEGVKNEYNKKM